MDKPVVFLMGPTAAGKTRLAVELVRRLPLEIISVDSAMVYRGMDIGTAKPSPDILKIAPHRLIDIRDPADSYSAARFRSDALAGIQEIHNAGRIPLLVGGTGLYFRALEYGLSVLPEGDPEIRRRIATEALSRGWEAMHAQLTEIDPATASKIHSSDPQRIQRALEVHALTGKTMTEHRAGKTRQHLPYRIVKIIISPAERKSLHARVRLRFMRMLEAGLIDEVRDLYARGDLHAGLPAMRLVGYRQVWAYLAGQPGYEEMVEKAIAATRQLIKRQLTWLRREEYSRWYDSEATGLTDNILKTLRDQGIISTVM